MQIHLMKGIEMISNLSNYRLVSFILLLQALHIFASDPKKKSTGPAPQNVDALKDSPGITLPTSAALPARAKKDNSENTSPSGQAQNPSPEHEAFTRIETTATANHLTQQTILGSTYPLPKVPEQTAQNYAWGDIHMGRTDDAYVSGLIGNGTFNLAYAHPELKDERLPGRNSNGLAILTKQLLTNQNQQQSELLDFVQKQRDQNQASINPILLLLQAINAHPAPKHLNLPTITESFSTVTKIRTNRLTLLSLLIKEFIQADKHLERVQQQLQDAHFTGSQSLPLPKLELPCTLTEKQAV